MAGVESINYSLRNIANRKTRSFLTVLSIFIGIATIFIFVSYGLGLFYYIEEAMSESSADKIIVQAKGMSAPGLDTTFKLEDRDVRAVKNVAGVFEATGVYFKVGDVEKSGQRKYVYAMGYDPKKPIIMDLFAVDVAEGRELRSGDTNKVVLGYNYLVEDKIFSKPYSLGEKIKVHNRSLQIVGFYEAIGNPQDDSNIYMTNEGIEVLYSDEVSSYGWVIARVDPNDLDNVVERTTKSLRKSRDLEEGKEDFFVQSFQDMIDSYASVLNIIVGFVLLIALISVLVSAVNTANTMITSVIERIKEIGVIKAIGAKNSEIFTIFLFESSFLGFIAGVIGVLLGWGLAAIGGVMLDNLGYGFLSPAFPFGLFAGCVLFAVVTGAVSGVIPAYRASKTNVVDALRYE